MKIKEAKRNANWCKYQAEMLEAVSYTHLNTKTEVRHEHYTNK